MGKVRGSSLWLAGTNGEWIGQSVGECLRQRATDDGDRPAIHWPQPSADGLTKLDYRTVYAQACRLARSLAGLVDPGSSVAVYSPSSVEWVLLELASALAGTVLVPMNPAMTGTEVDYILRLAQVRVVFTVEEYRGRALEDELHALTIQSLPGLVVLNLPRWARDAGGAAALPEVSPADRFIIQYTSGTTGKPKGAVHTHEAALNAGAGWCRDWGHAADDVLITPAPLFHVGGSIAAVLGTVATGASMGIMSQYDPAALVRLVEDSRATVLGAVPTILFDLLAQPGFSADRLPHLHTIIGGGAYVPPDTVRAIEEKFGVDFIVSYGQSESPAILQTRRDDPLEIKAGSLGRPLPGRDVRIARRDGSTADDGQVGEICTRSRMDMVSYIGQPSATAEVIDREGWLHTGDLGAMDANGYVAPHGRARDVIIRGGENIYPDEVEYEMRLHPAVSAVAVVAAPDDRWGEIPVGFVVPTGVGVFDPAELTAFGRNKLASFKVPKRWITVESLPTTASGKVRRIELRQRLLGQQS